MKAFHVAKGPNQIENWQQKPSAYQRLRKGLGALKFTSIGRRIGIWYTAVEFWLWQIGHPGGSFADYYSNAMVKQLARGIGHPTLGKLQLFPSVPFVPVQSLDPRAHHRRGREQFQLLIESGLRPHHVCVDFGCGSLRVGQHLIEFLEPNRYWGLDIVDRFYRDGIDQLMPGVFETKGPILRTISAETLRDARLAEPSFIVCFSVLPHVPPSETELLFDRLFGLMGDKTTVVVFSFRESVSNFRAAGKAWARDGKTIEQLVHSRRPKANIAFHRQIRKKRGYPQWPTTVVVT